MTCVASLVGGVFCIELMMMSRQVQRVKTCLMCKNHGVTSPLRGHKNNCPYKNCSCLSCKTTQEVRRSRCRVKRTYGYQPDENSEVLQQFENRTDERESDENQKVIAWINGEEKQDESLGEEVFIC